MPLSRPRARVRSTKCDTDAIGRQRLPPEPERHDRREIVGPADLAGRVPLDRQPRIVRVHSLAVVLDAHLPLAAELDVNRQPPRAGVDRVLDQLLDDRRRPLDDLARRNLVREIRRQPADFAHDTVSVTELTEPNGLARRHEATETTRRKPTCATRVFLRASS